MPHVKLDRVISVSSEDPVYPASNLIKENYDNKKWKGKIGEKSINVVFQLEKPTKIVGIDVGNENSAFIEILVGNTNEPNIFKPLVGMSSLMSLREAKDGENVNGVKNFKSISFSESTKLEKWDLIKFICSQPYNIYAQFGLSFVVLHTDENNENTDKLSINLGNFHLKTEKEEQTILHAGGLFAQRKELKELTKGPEFNKDDKQIINKKIIKVDPSGASGVSDDPEKPASNDSTLVQIQMDLDSQEQDDILAALEDSGSEYEPSGSGSDIEIESDVISDDDSDSNEAKPKKPKTPKLPKVAKVRKNSPSPPPQKKPRAAKINALKKCSTKDFNKFFENVVFVISGFQNPLRGEIRSKAIAMGGKYKPDWDPSCTHLICAFPNTPKYNQVRKKAKIVKKEWIEECYSKRIAFPWRRYALDPNQLSRPESDEEIYEKIDLPEQLNNRARIGDSGSEDTEDEIERIRLKNKDKIVKKRDSSEEPMPGPSRLSPPKTSIYDMDTEEEDFGLEDTKELPFLADFFQDSVFLILDDLNQDERNKLKRYIIAHKGKVATDKTDFDEIEFVISEDPNSVALVKNDYPSVTGIKPEYVWRCHDQQKLLPLAHMEI